MAIVTDRGADRAIELAVNTVQPVLDFIAARIPAIDIARGEDKDVSEVSCAIKKGRTAFPEGTLSSQYLRYYLGAAKLREEFWLKPNSSLSSAVSGQYAIAHSLEGAVEVLGNILRGNNRILENTIGSLRTILDRARSEGATVEDCYAAAASELGSLPNFPRGPFAGLKHLAHLNSDPRTDSSCSHNPFVLDIVSRWFSASMRHAELKAAEAAGEDSTLDAGQGAASRIIGSHTQSNKSLVEKVRSSWQKH